MASKKKVNAKADAKEAKENKSKASKVSSSFAKTIQEYLDKFAQENEFFAEKYKNPKKSIDECCDFIISEVQKMNVQGLADEEVYYLARHYYEEDDLGKISTSRCNVVVNHAAELTEEDKARLREQAEKNFLAKEEERLKKKAVADAQKEANKKAKEEAKRQAKIKENHAEQLSLFDF